jgi:cell fate (sporulation/competence/biofilm development) regulator YlbF (YheA/YmcA/DUF963 family)
MFGNSSKPRKTTLAGRVKKLQAKVDKKEKIAALKKKEVELKRKLSKL